MSAFNPESFLSTEISDANSTEYIPCPAGEYAARLDKLSPRVLTDGRAVLDISWIVDDEEAREATGMAEPRVRQTIWLDTTEQGGLDFGKGKNVQLGKLREAVNQNLSGQPWQPAMLLGQVARIKVKNGIDKRDNSATAEVSAVAAL